MTELKKYSRGFFSAAFLFVCINSLYAQTENTFRQQVDHTLHVTLDDRAHTLQGDAQFTYHNNSPHTLDTLWLHVWPNAYSGSHTALAQQLVSKRNERLKLAANRTGGRIDSLRFMVDGKEAQWHFHDRHKDLAYIFLQTPLKPGDSCTVYTPFRTHIPQGSVSQFGHVGRDYYITNWYPAPAVYDDQGWHPIPFIDQRNLYTEFGNFDVEITLPSSYIVASSGTLQTQAEKDALYKRAHKNKDGMSSAVPNVDGEVKTLRYTVKNAHHFAFFASKEYQTQLDSLTLPGGKRIDIYAFCHPKRQKIWANALSDAKQSISFFSQHIGEYPYEQYSMVDAVRFAGGGQTYTGVSVIAGRWPGFPLSHTITIATANLWFNESVGADGMAYPWLTEGVSSYYYRRYWQENKPPFHHRIPLVEISNFRFLNHHTWDYVPYLYFIRKGREQTFGSPSYTIPTRHQEVLLFYYLEQYLGKPTFDSALQKFYKEFQFAKPDAEGFKKSIEAQTGKELGWFFDGLLYQNGKVDYAIQKVEKFKNEETGKKELGVRIINRGNVPGPFPVSVGEGNNVITVWEDGFLGEKIIFLPKGDYRLVQIDKNEVMPDIDRKNNTYKIGKLFPKLEKLALSFVGGVPEQTSREEIFVAPFPLWNNYNKTMLGIVVHNKSFIRKKWEYLLAPMISLNPASFAFMGNISGMFPLEHKKVESISYKVSYTRLDYFFDSKPRPWNKIAGKWMMNFRSPAIYKDRRMQLFVRNIFNILNATDDYRTALGVNNLAYNVNEIGFQLRDDRLLHPYQFTVMLEYIQELNSFSKPGISAGNAGKLWAEYRQRVTYLGANKGLDIRLFAGTFLGVPNTVLDYRYRMSAFPGYWDYKFDNYYFDRGESINTAPRQLSEHDGGFKVLTPIGQTSRWMIAMNLKASLPVPIPIKPFFDMALHRQVVTIVNTGELKKSVNFSYSGGIMLSVVNDVLEIYVPLIHSKDIRDYLSLHNSKWYDQVRFKLNLLELNPKRIREKLEWWPR